MTYDLTLTSATFGTGKFGQGLTGGRGIAPLANPVLPANKTFTVEAWGNTTSTVTAVLLGQNNAFWVASSGGKALAHYTSTGGDTTITTNVTVNDGAWHHFALCVDATAVGSGGTGAKFYVDGVLAGSNTLAGSANTTQYDFGVGTFGGVSGYDWVGAVDEAVVWSTLRYTGAFTPPASAYSGSESGQVALWHLDGNGTNSAGAGAVDTTAPTASAAAVANSTPSVVSITMSEAMDTSFVPAASAFTVSGHTVTGVTISPSTVINLTCTTNFVNGEAARTVSYTQPGANNARDVAGNLLANFTGLAVTNNATAADTTPPVFVSAQVTNSARNVIILTFNENLGSVTPAASAFAASGGRNVTGVGAPSGATISITVDSAYASSDTITVAYTKPGTNQLQDVAGNQAVSFAAQPVTNNIQAPTLNTTLVQFSPGNWSVQSDNAATVNPGAYFRTLFTGNSLTLNFDMAGVTGTSVPQLIYRVNGSAWVIADIAASVPITIPNGMSSFPHNILEVVFKSADGTQGRWATLGAIVKWTGITGGAVLSKPTGRALAGMYFGDSITEGNNIISNGGAVTFNNAAYVTWAFRSAELLGAEAGIVGFGSQGINVAGAGGVPALTASYPYLYSGVSRVWPTSLDYVVINMGQNDGPGSGNSASCAAILNGILAAVPSNTKIFVLRPFSGNQAASWTAGIAACNAPARCVYVDTTGWFNTSDSYDTVHPNAYAGQTMGEQLASAIRSGLAGAPTLAARTVSLTLGDTSGALANLAGLKVAFYDEATPDLHSKPRYQTASGTTNASGVLSFTVQSTLASSGTGCLVVQMADGRNLVASVPVT